MTGLGSSLGVPFDFAQGMLCVFARIIVLLKPHPNFY